MQKITPFLWFNNQAEEAAHFYVDLFNGNPGKKIESKMTTVNKYDESGAEASGQQAGSTMISAFEIEGQQFTAINGGPHFTFSGAVSFVIDCTTQEEVDYFWEKLSADGGEAGQCGWINRDKYGITWQVVPSRLSELLGDPDQVKSERVMKAMLQMTKINIADLEKAYND